MLLLPLTTTILLAAPGATPTNGTPLSDLPPPSAETVETALEPAPGFALASLYQAQESHDEHNETYLRVTGGFLTSEESEGPDEEIDFDEGYLVSVGFGGRLTEWENGGGFGLELDGVWTDQDTDDDGPIESVEDVTVLGALINGIFDFRLAERFSIYAGAGVGAAWADVGTQSDALNDFDDEDGPFLAWQAKAGLAWRFGDGDTALHFGYRFLNIDDIEIDDDVGGASFDLETQQHVLEAGLIFGF
jgi:opacity protein-like surface antigen